MCSEVNSEYYYQSMFTIRFDMRAPATGAATTDLYAAAVDMCAWVDSRGGQTLPLAPLCGGVPPDVAWPYLKRAAEAVTRIG